MKKNMRKPVVNKKYNGSYESIVAEFEGSPPVKTNYDSSAVIGESFLDSASFTTIEVESLFQTLNKTQLKLGEVALYRSLTNPLMDSASVVSRQDGLRELSENKILRDEFSTLIDDIKNHEEGLFDLMWRRFVGFSGADVRHESERSGFGYDAFKHSRRLLQAIKKTSLSISQPETSFLGSIVDDLKLINTNRTSQLILDKAYVTERGIKTKKEKKWWIPGYRFRPSLFKPVFFTLILTALMALFNFVDNVHGGLGSGIGPIVLFMGAPLLIFTMLMIGAFDRDNFINPIGKILLKDPEIQSILDALGEIETLLIHDKFFRHFTGPVCLPSIIEVDQHQLIVEDLWNAPIGIVNESYIGNDISMLDDRLNFITGPNSGGKTALCKTICQSQILGQSGGYVPAKKMSFSIVKHIYYQTPEAGSLDTAQGRFATELERTRDIFFNCKEASLVVLDEPFEGTSYEERLEITRDILDGFIKTGASVFFITHNFPLVHLYEKQKTGQFLETVFEDNVFTHHFKEGIASTSHADRVVAQLGFSKEDIKNHLNNN